MLQDQQLINRCWIYFVLQSEGLAYRCFFFKYESMTINHAKCPKPQYFWWYINFPLCFICKLVSPYVCHVSFLDLHRVIFEFETANWAYHQRIMNNISVYSNSTIVCGFFVLVLVRYWLTCLILWECKLTWLKKKIYFVLFKLWSLLTSIYTLQIFTFLWLVLK